MSSPLPDSLPFVVAQKLLVKTSGSLSWMRRSFGQNDFLVDDEPQVRCLLRVCLQSAGFEVIEAECGLKALEIVEQNCMSAVDLLVTDIEMPDMDGITLAERCQRQIPNLRVVAISGFTEEVIPAVGTGIDAYIQKPFSPRALMETVTNVLSRVPSESSGSGKRPPG